jgi:hypothetical protein
MATLEELLQAINPANTYQRYIGQPFANVAGPFGRGFLGLQRPEYGSEEAYRTGQAVSNMPAVGIPAGAMKAAAQVPGLLADVMQAAKGSDELAGLLALTAYHGSPHRFSKFDASKIGTGEGAQAYGHGLYFAESPDVARAYMARDLPMEDRFLKLYSQAERQQNYPAMQVLEDFMMHKSPQQISESLGGFEGKDFQRAQLAYQQALKEFNKRKTGGFYQVDIPDEMIGKMLDYDKPLKEQPEVLKAIRNAVIDDPDIRKSFEFNVEKGISGANAMANYIGGSPGEVAQKLRSVGIPGVRYLDQGSRGAGKGTRNFVVFPGEEEAVKMLSVE